MTVRLQPQAFECDDSHVARFARALEHLPPDECEIVTRAAEMVAEGAGIGLGSYGPLRLDRDKRDFRHEAEQEVRDLLFYLIADNLRQEARLRRLDRDTDPIVGLEGSEIERE